MASRADSPGLAGVLVVDKPAGPTSHDVVARVRKALGERRVGHSGTLDPFATGVLACAVGRATRLVRYFAGDPKVYEGEIALGQATDTLDSTGTPVGPAVVPTLHADGLAAALRSLSGVLMQVPPMHSAKKVAGTPLHVLARRGEDVPRAPARVEVAWELAEISAPDSIRFRVRCSAGTYVRVLAADLGALLGCPAHLASLRRLSAGAFTLEQAVAGDPVDPAAARRALIPIQSIPLGLRDAHVADAACALALSHGRALRPSDVRLEGAAPSPGEALAVRSPEGALLAIVRATPDDLLQPEVVLVAE